MNFFIPFYIGLKSFTKKGRSPGPGKSPRLSLSLPSQMKGAILGIGLSLIPLIVVLVVTNGMIEGITQRFIEISTYHIQVNLNDYSSSEEMNRVAQEMISINGVSFAFVEKSGFALIRSRDQLSGVTVRAAPQSLYSEDKGFRKYIRVDRGEFLLSGAPGFISPDIFNSRLQVSLEEKDREFVSRMYELDPATQLYSPVRDIAADDYERLIRIFLEARVYPILLGRSLAETLKADIGDQIYILAYNDFHSKIVLKSAKCIVTGIFSTGYQEIDKVLTYIPSSAGQAILPSEKSKEFIGVKVTDPFGNISDVTRQIQEFLTSKQFLFASCESWYDLQINQYRAFQTTKVVLIFIMVLIIIVAAVNVYSSMTMLIMEKNTEIAILKSMGATPFLVSASFLIIGFNSGIAGCIIGVTAGLTIAVNINELIKGVEYLLNLFIHLFRILAAPLYQFSDSGTFRIFNPEFYLEEIPVRVNFPEVFFIAFVTIFIASLAAFLPAARAGKINPLEVIRKY